MSIKPIFRATLKEPINEGFDAALSTLMQHIREAVNEHGAMRSCLNCLHFAEETELCGKFASRPPARVIAYSCPAYEDKDDIPF
jgi:hypothetical protein